MTKSGEILATHSVLGELGPRMERLEDALPDSSLGGADELAAVRERLCRPRASIAFGGLFKAGKSTLLNSLLGRRVLPTDTLPETGALCTLRSEAADRGLLFRQGDGLPEPCPPEAIRDLTGLVGEDGSRREERLREIDRIELALHDTRIPVGTEWIDSPGIDDSPEMDEVARRAARRADLLVWVLSSRHALTEPEMAFLAEHVEHSGPASVLFVLNLIGSPGRPLDAEDALRPLRPKLEGFWQEAAPEDAAPPPLWAVDAADLARESADGGAGLVRFLGELDGPAHPAVLRARTFRPIRALREIRDRLVVEQEVQIERERKLRHERQELRHRLALDVESALEEYVRSRRDEVERALPSALSTLRSAILAGSETAQDDFRLLPSAAGRPHEELVRAVQRSALGADRGSFGDGRAAELERRLRPPSLSAPAIEIPSGGTVGMPLLGAVLGTVACIPGTVVGGLIGHRVAKRRLIEARERTADEAIRALRQRVARHVRQMEDRAASVRDWLVDALDPGELPPRPTAHLDADGVGELIDQTDRCIRVASVLAEGSGSGSCAIGDPGPGAGEWQDPETSHRGREPEHEPTRAAF